MNGRAQLEPLAYALASSGERRTALLTTITLIAFSAVSVWLGPYLLGASDSLVPSSASASFVALVVSATILRNQYRTSRFAPFAFLSVGFVLTALLLVPYTLAYPRAFSPDGFGIDPQIHMWLWVAWHASFVMGIAAYVWSESFFARSAVAHERMRTYLRTYALVATAGTGLVVLGIFRYAPHLPPLLTSSGTTPIFHALVGQVLLASCAIVALALVVRTQLRHTAHLWLGVVLVGFAIEVTMRGQIAERPFSVGWYAGLAFGLAWQMLFLTAQLRHANEQLAAYASDKRNLIEATIRDALTGCRNRRGFDASLGEAIVRCRVARAPLALLVLDLDQFKHYNDHFGHVAGDDALRSVATAVSGIANRGSDVCCRIGGEEFAIVLAMTDATGALVVAERVREAVMRLRIAHAPEATHGILTVSLGFAVMEPETSIDATQLYAAADRALYRAKSLGRNRIMPYDRPVVAPVTLRAV